MSTMPRAVRGKFAALEEQLSAQRNVLRSLFARQRQEVCVERETDDECAEANRNLARHLALSALDRERRMLGEIEMALGRIKAGDYGICEACGCDISGARLRALPWARFCIRCAERSTVS